MPCARNVACLRLQEIPSKECGVAAIASSSGISDVYLVMKKPTSHLSVRHGFSLVELLVVIAVIAIIAAIAIPNIANITGAAQQSSFQRNAQNIASVASAARAAGYATAWTSISNAIAELTNGVSVTVGTQTMSFKVDSLTDAQVTGASAYLTNDGTNVYYKP